MEVREYIEGLLTKLEKALGEAEYRYVVTGLTVAAAVGAGFLEHKIPDDFQEVLKKYQDSERALALEVGD